MYSCLSFSLLYLRLWKYMMAFRGAHSCTSTTDASFMVMSQSSCSWYTRRQMGKLTNYEFRYRNDKFWWIFTPEKS